MSESDTSSSSGECSDSSSSGASTKQEKKKLNVVDENASKGKKRAAENAQKMSVKKPREEEAAAPAASASASGSSSSSTSSSDSSSTDSDTEAQSEAKDDNKIEAPQQQRKRTPRKSRSRSKQRGSRRSKSLERRRLERQRRHEEQAKREEMKKTQLETAIADNDTVTVPAARITEKQVKTVDLLTSRTGGAYIPPAKLRLMQAEFTDKSSAAYQRIAWEALKKSIHGYINKVNVFNIAIITRELLNENIVRGRGLLCRSIIQAQAASPTFTHVYAALVAIINSKFPNIGELLLKRLIIQFKRAFRRNDKAVCISASRFVAHLVNQRVAHEILALEILTLLVEKPTDDSVEVAIAFLKECGMKLTEVSSKGVGAIFEMLKNILHEGKLEKRVQYMIEVAFQVRKDGFKDHQAVIDKLELVEEDDQYTHLMMLDDANDPEDGLNVFKYDDQYEQHEGIYKGLSKEILGSESDDSDSSGSGSADSSEAEEDAVEAGETIIDNTETNLIALRRTIYLTINSSLDYEECAHKLMKMQLKPGQEVELCHMFLDCCAEQRTYEKFYGLLAQRFCSINKVYIEPFEKIFRDTYHTTHRLDTNRLRNVAKFFAHLLFTDAISWDVLECIKLNEDDTTSSSRIFIKILFQELAEYMGLSKLNGKLKDDVLLESLAGLFPKDNPRNTRFAINFFTSIGLGGLTDELRQFLKTGPRSVPAINEEILTNKVIKVEDSSSSSSSSDSSSDSDSDSTSSSDTTSSSSSMDSSQSSSDSSEAEKSRKKKKSKKRVAAKKRLSKNKKKTQKHKETKSKGSKNKKGIEQENGNAKKEVNVSEGEQRRKAREERHKQRKNDKNRNGRGLKPRSPSASGSVSEASRKRSCSSVVEFEPPKKRRPPSHSREKSRREDMHKRREERKARSPSPSVEKKRQDRARSRSRNKELKEHRREKKRSRSISKRDKKRSRSVSSIKERKRDKRRSRSVSKVKERQSDKKRSRSISNVRELTRNRKRSRSVSSIKELTRDKKRSRSISSVKERKRDKKRSRSVSNIHKERSGNKKRSRSVSNIRKERSRDRKRSHSLSREKELTRNKKRSVSNSSIRKERNRGKKRNRSRSLSKERTRNRKRSRSASSIHKGRSRDKKRSRSVEKSRDYRRRDRSRERKRSVSG